MAGPGLVLASADKLKTTASSENPSAFGFENSDPWGAITIALRQTSVTKQVFGEELGANQKLNRIVVDNLTLQDGARLENIVVEGDVFDVNGADMDNVLITGDLTIETAGVYNFNDVVVLGDVTNSDATGNVTINLTGNSSLSTSEPGTGNGQVNIVNTVTITITDLQPDSEVRLYAGTLANASAAVEIAGVESSGSEVQLQHNNVGQAAYIVIHKEEYITKYFVFPSLSALDQSLPAGQQFDRNFENP